jgi:alkanesulfonate monooxygenase SsuD/methylene tetrahydromethanopterin reductase-like flavin-dependent oxidoreductase (luciferase family)
VKFGLLLNAGEFPGLSHDDIFDLILAEAQLADDLGYSDIWLTEHHFIPFGINPSSLAGAAFFLGRTENLRVGTAVVLAPLYPPVQLAEQAALLDQLSGGRFDLGIGRGGYLRDYGVFEVSTDRHAEEAERSISTILEAWDGKPLASTPQEGFDVPATLNPHPRTRPRPSLFVASSTPGSVSLAARNQLPLLNYFATPVSARRKLLDGYNAAAGEAGVDVGAVEHVQSVICVVSTDPEADVRERLMTNIAHSYAGGEWPHVPGMKSRHAGPNGESPSPEQYAQVSVANAVAGSPDAVGKQLARFIEATNTRHLTLFMELAAEPARVLDSVRLFALEVMPSLAARFPDRGLPQTTAAGSRLGRSQ